MSQEPTPIASTPGFLARFFRFAERQTNLRTELLAGATTFLTMAYILAVNPAILSNAIFLVEPQDLFNELVIATAIASALATLVMGVFANYPFALAPGMGLNAFFAFSVVLGLGIDWRVALAAVFIEGLIFIILTLTELRRQLVVAIPGCLRQATTVGIGLFIAYLALTGDPATGGAGIIVSNPATTTSLGDLSNPATLMTLIGFLVTAALVARRVTGALLWGILLTAGLGWTLGIAPPPTGFAALPQFPSNLALQALAGFGQLGSIPWLDFLAVVLVFLFVDLFDTIGTLTGVGMQAGFLREDGELPQANQALMADAIGTSIGALLGTSTVTSYIESAAGVSEGGRTGMTAIATAVLFLLSIFFIPVIAAVPSFATAPALLIVGVLMAGNVRGIRWDDPAESIPSFLTILVMPLSFSIAEGLAVGFITYPVIKSLQGKFFETNIATWYLAGIFLLRFALQSLGFGG